MAASDPTTSPRAEQRRGLSFRVDTRLFEVIALHTAGRAAAYGIDVSHPANIS
jgi:hypothetical protein